MKEKLQESEKSHGESEDAWKSLRSDYHGIQSELDAKTADFKKM